MLKLKSPHHCQLIYLFSVGLSWYCISHSKEYLMVIIRFSYMKYLLEKSSLHHLKPSGYV
jgi:hypothetical protein